MNHGYMGFSKVDENSNFVACEEKKKKNSEAKHYATYKTQGQGLPWWSSG